METNPKQPADLDSKGKLRNKLAKLAAQPEPTNKDTTEPTIDGLHLFPKKVLDKLPEPYKSLIQALRYETDQSALLASLLVVGSGTLPKIYFYHGSNLGNQPGSYISSGFSHSGQYSPHSQSRG